MCDVALAVLSLEDNREGVLTPLSFDGVCELGHLEQ
jgi:hypothetical protein